MKQQALAFFTMFSLILMLSVYYITTPDDISVSKKSVPVMEDNNTYKNEESYNNEIIAGEYSSEEKEKAIKENETLKVNEKLLNEVNKLLKDSGYENKTEIKDKTIYIYLEMKEDELVAREVLKLVYNHVKDSFFIEVQFV